MLKPCATGAVDGPHERSQNFQKVLDTFFQGAPPAVPSQITGPAHQILPPVMFTPEVNPNYGNSGSNSVTSQTTEPEAQAQSESDESLGAVIHNPITIPDEASTLNNDLTTEQPDHASHDSQIPNSMTVYSCRDDVDPRMKSLSIDIPFNYEVFVSSRDIVGDAMQDLKKKVIQDIGSSLGCNISSSRRRLGQSVETGVIVGFQSPISSNDLTYEACTSVMNDSTAICLSAKSYLTTFMDLNASAEDIQASNASILSIIAAGMQNDAFISDDIKRVVFVGDGNVEPQPEQSKAAPVSVPATEAPDSRSPVWIPIFVTLVIIIVAAVNIAFIRRYKHNTNSAKVASLPKTLAFFVSNLEGVPTPKMESNYSESSESIDECQLDCFEELNGPPFDKSESVQSSVSDHFSRESDSEIDLGGSSDDRIVLYLASEHSSQTDVDLRKK